ncbi:MAG: DUF1295 domain-containing protein [Halieaceae bacterium]|jgi:steroid 5-alpha reductase family enzyme|nr:DUF1295 domain-containing protein [Halieaceae bacterium]
MNDRNAPAPGRSIAGISITIAIAAATALAGSRGGLELGPMPAFTAVALLAFAVQWLAFVPAFVAQTERYYDLTGSLTYLSTALLALSVKGDARSLLLALLIALWAVRLGSFLFLRIRADGRDQRFDRIKPFFFRFLMTWTLQGLWVLMTAGAALAAMTSARSVPLGAWAYAGAALWLIGFAIEAVADAQKRRFRRDPANRGRFISSGLWAWSRHPNYFGEILLWAGIAFIALPALEGWQYVTLVSPLFVYLLLTRVSGVPMLERIADKRWGEDPAYQAYRDSTPVLLPRPPRSSGV